MARSFPFTITEWTIVKITSECLLVWWEHLSFGFGVGLFSGLGWDLFWSFFRFGSEREVGFFGLFFCLFLFFVSFLFGLSESVCYCSILAMVGLSLLAVTPNIFLK